MLSSAAAWPVQFNMRLLRLHIYASRVCAETARTWHPFMSRLLGSSVEAVEWRVRDVACPKGRFARSWPVTLESAGVPDCPPGLASRRFWLASMHEKTTLDSRRYRARTAIMDGIPPTRRAS